VLQTAIWGKGMNESSTNVPAGRGAVAVIGGGVAGLVASITAAQAGAQVSLYEGAKKLGGRAFTTEHEGFYINMGPHALYLEGAAHRILGDLGVAVSGGAPVLEGTNAVFEGRKYRLPFSLKSIMFSRFLHVRDKMEVIGFYSKLPKLDAASYRYVSQQTLVDDLCKRPRARHFVNAMCRLGTYSNAPQYLSAEVMINQLLIGMGGVLYLDKGWNSLVKDLADKARACGVNILTGKKVKRIRKSGAGAQVLLGETVDAVFDAAIMCVAPGVVARICSDISQIREIADNTIEIRAACLELALNMSFKENSAFALGMDEPTYFSVHSKAAKLAPGGAALVQAALYLPVGGSGATNARAKLEGLVSLMQPAWKDKLVHAIYRPQALVSHMLPTATQGGLKGRPATQLDTNLFVAGDWVGEEGLLSDAAVASAHLAAKKAVNTLALN